MWKWVGGYSCSWQEELRQAPHQQNWALNLYPIAELSKPRKALKPCWCFQPCAGACPWNRAFSRSTHIIPYFCALPTNQLFLTPCSTLEVLMAMIRKCKRGNRRKKVRPRVLLRSRAPEPHKKDLDEHAKTKPSFKTAYYSITPNYLRTGHAKSYINFPLWLEIASLME